MQSYNDIISNMRVLGGAIHKKYDVIAAGGTSLVLHGIKESTDDVDFIVIEGDAVSFEISYKKYCDVMIDVSAAGECFGTRLPGDYVIQSKYIDAFGMVTVRTLSILDTIITKSTRSNPKDYADIKKCVSHINRDDVIGRLWEYQLENGSIAYQTVTDIFGGQ